MRGAIAFTQEQPRVVGTSITSRLSGLSARYFAEPCTYFCMSRQTEDRVAAVGSGAVIVNVVVAVAVSPARSVALVVRVLGPSGSSEPATLTPWQAVPMPDVTSLDVHGITMVCWR